MIENNMRPVHPGEILNEEYLKPLSMSVDDLANKLRLPEQKLNDLIKSQIAITPDTALRLAHYFGEDAQSWLNLQATYDLKVTKEKLGVELDNIKPLVKKGMHGVLTK